MADFEKLGAFYLGRVADDETGETSDETILYDAKDLTTHAMCVGMTGSGKTGLCLSLLEEAAIDGIPALIIDPKGDLGNLLLTFPQLRAADFEPWVDESAAARKGLTVGEYAAETANTWRDGLEQWGQDGARIARCRAAAERTIYTPGSSAGVPLTVLRSFAAPPPELRQDADAIRDRVNASVSGLLALLGVDADPIQSREHILLANILDRAWRDGRDVELTDLIQEIQTPPFAKVGVFDVDSFYPAKERFGLAMRLNNMLASPGFAAWTEGDPLDIKSLLYTAEGRPRQSILSIAHLSDSERMFFVTIVLNEVLAWIRTQPGTTSLRAILYMDEIYGYFPPNANPPSKTPMLTLLKQARAYGLGCVLATQNPVDLDYKGLGNTGTWFIGRLQTERDKGRLLDGLEGASGTTGQDFDRRRLERTLSRLGNRVFLMSNVHEDAPVVFQTRWALSYLRGPLTRSQIATLMSGRQRSPAAPAAPAVAAPTVVPPTPEAAAEEPAAAAKRTPLPPGINQYFLPRTKQPTANAKLVYRPFLCAVAQLHYASATAGVDLWRDLSLLGPVPDEADSALWDEADVFRDRKLSTRKRGESGGAFAELPAAATSKNNYTAWQRALKSYLYREQSLQLWKCAALKAISKANESEGDFLVRLRQLAHERRDLALEKLRAKYATKTTRLQDRIRRAEERVEREKSQYKQQKLQTVIGMGSTLLGALLGRKAVSSRTVGRAATTMRSAGRVAREKGDIGRASDSVETLVERLGELERAFEEDIEKVKDGCNPEDLVVTEIPVRPRKSDINIGAFGLVWTPWHVDADGIADPAFTV